MKKRYIENQIIGLLKRPRPVHRLKSYAADTGFPEANYYTFQNKFSGMGIPGAKWLKALENSRLKRLLAESMLENVQ